MTASTAPDERPLRVTMLTSLPPSKGISTYSMPLLSALSERRDVSVEALSFRRMYPSFLYPGGEPVHAAGSGPARFRFPARPVLHWANPIAWVTNSLRLSSDVVHAQWWSQVLAPIYITVLAIAKARGRKVVLTIHNVSAHEPSAWKAFADSRVRELADHFIVHTPENAEALLRMEPRAKGRISVVPMGAQDVENRRGLTREEARDRLGIAKEDRVVLFFGNIRPYKGLDDMVDAFPLVSRAVPNTRLLVVGQPWSGAPEVEAALEKARSLPNCSLRLEFVSDEEAEAYFAACDVAAFPYKGFEAQSGACARAIAFDRAMVVSDEGGLKAFVRDQRAVVPAGNVDALAGALTAVLKDDGLRDKLEADAMATSRELDWGAIAEQTARIYRRLLPAERPAPAVRMQEAAESE
jgi:glycosyltransferase involved in cell wall biosynthesis